MTAGLVGQDPLLTFVSPTQRQGPIDPNIVRTQDNIVRDALNTHTADPSVHFQSSTATTRPTAANAGTAAKWIDSDTERVYYSDGAAWHEIAYLALDGATQSTIGANGAASALTANPVGYQKVLIGGVARIIPYYNP